MAPGGEDALAFLVFEQGESLFEGGPVLVQVKREVRRGDAEIVRERQKDVEGEKAVGMNLVCLSNELEVVKVLAEKEDVGVEARSDSVDDLE